MRHSGSGPGFWVCKKRESDERERRWSELAHERRPVGMFLSESRFRSDPCPRPHMRCLSPGPPPD